MPQKSASTEATHEIHYIPSVLLGPQGRDSYRGSRNTHQHGSSVIGMPIRETPILDDYDCDEDDPAGHSYNSTPNQIHNKLSDGKLQNDYGVGVGGHMDMMRQEDGLKHNFEKQGKLNCMCFNRLRCNLCVSSYLLFSYEQHTQRNMWKSVVLSSCLVLLLQVWFVHPRRLTVPAPQMAKPGQFTLALVSSPHVLAAQCVLPPFVKNKHFMWLTLMLHCKC